MTCPRCGNDCTEERRRRGSLVDFWCYLCCFAFSITRRAAGDQSKVQAAFMPQGGEKT